MDTCSLQYFIELCVDMNMTQTATRLFMSQQTLGNHIRRLEAYYGVQLFNRKPHLQLTPAGTELREYALAVIEKERSLTAHLSDIAHLNRGSLTIGVNYPRSNSFLPSVIEDFKKHYPNIEITLIERSAGGLLALAQKNQIDFIVCITDDKEAMDNSLEILSIHQDPIYICVPDRLMKQYLGDTAECIKQNCYTGVDIGELKDIPLMMLLPENRLGQITRQCYLAAGCQPNIYMYSSRANVITSICNRSLAMGLISHMSLCTWGALLKDEVNIFPLNYKNKPLKVNISIVHHKSRYMPIYAQYFLEKLKESIVNLQQTELRHLYKEPNADPASS